MRRFITLRRFITRALAIAVARTALARPLPADITFNTAPYNNTRENPPPTQANMNIINQAIRRLVGDPRLAV